MTDRPLAGLRVVITRASHQSAALAEALRELGAEPVNVPLIDITEPADQGVALKRALERLHTFDWLVVTSPNGAERVASAVSALAAAGVQRPQLAVVGSATATTLSAPAHVVPAHQTAAGLLRDFPRGSGSVLLAQSDIADSRLADGLTAKGWRVEAVPAYSTVLINPTASAKAAATSADAVLFASGSAVRSWIASFDLFTPSIAIAIGPTTNAVAQRFGLKITAVCADHSSSGLVDCLVACVLEHR